MKVHKSVLQHVPSYYISQALDAWDREGVAPGYEKLCDGLMVKTGTSLTSENKNVTCLRCLKKLSKK